MYPTFTMAGENALIITLGDDLTIPTNTLAITTEKTIQQNKPPYIIESTPLLRSVFIRYDTQQTDFDAVVSDIKKILAKNKNHSAKNKTRIWTLPICYEKQYAPDIKDLAKLMNLTPTEIITAHSQEILQVLMLGFAPGWIYGGLLPPIWNVPRLTSAKPNVPAGAISVAVRQMIVSTTLSPTGWRTIGQTPYLNFDLSRPQEDIFTMQAGDHIKIQKISAKEFTLLKEDYANHRQRLSYEDIETWGI